MAKEQFERVKPHVNVGTIGRTQSALQQFGISQAGATQLLHGHLVSNPEDRKAIAGLVAKLLPSNGRSDVTNTITYTGLE